VEIKKIQIFRNHGRKFTTGRWILEISMDNGEFPESVTTYYLNAKNRKQAQEEAERHLDDSHVGWRG